MPSAGALSRKRFWAGALCALAGAGGLYWGRGLETGSLAAPGPGAFPLALSAIAVLFAAVELLRGAIGPYRPDADTPPLWQRPFALAAGAAAAALALLALFGPLSPFFARFGAGASLAWYAFVLIACAAAAARMPGGAPARALGAAILGLLLGTSGLDPLTPSLARYAVIDSGLYFNFVHGLVLALLAYHVGFNALLIAAAVALSPKIETALRQGLAGAEGKIPTLFDHPASLALLAGAALVLVIAAIAPPRRAMPALALGRTMMLGREAAPAARTGLYAGAAAVLIGAAGLYFGAGIGLRGPEGLPGTLGPGAAPMALSAALVALGLLLLAWAAIRRAPEQPAPPFARAPATIAAAVLIVLLFLLLAVAPYAVIYAGWPPVDFLLRFGPPETAALILLIAVLGVVAAWLLPGGSFLRALGALALGLLLSTLGLDPVTGTIRYTHEIELQAVHGLVLGFAAYRLGFNPLLIAVGFLFGERLENALRQALIITQGDVAVLADRPVSLGLLIAAGAALVLGAALRLWQRRYGKSGAASFSA